MNRRSPIRNRRPTKVVKKKRPPLDAGILFHLVRLGNAIDVRQLLLSATDDHGSISKGFDDIKNTSLHIAAQAGNVSVLRVLLSFGAKSNAQNINGDTPLLLSWSSWSSIPETSLLRPAAMCTVESVIELLLQYGADPNLSNFQTGETPLHLAARNGHSKLIKRFLKFRARPDHKSKGKDGVTPKDLAMKGDSPEHQKCNDIMKRWHPEKEDFNPDELARKHIQHQDKGVAWSGATFGRGGGKRSGNDGGNGGGSDIGNTSIGASLKRQQQQLALLSSTESNTKMGKHRFNPKKRLGALRQPKTHPSMLLNDAATSKNFGNFGNGLGSGRKQPELDAAIRVVVGPIIIKRFGFDKKFVNGLSCGWSPSNGFHESPGSGWASKPVTPFLGNTRR